MNRFIVVGAGPAGLSLSLQLARGGADVTLVEARQDFDRGLRGDALMPSGLEALARMGLWTLLMELPQRPLQGWQVWLEGTALFTVAEPMGSLQPCRLVRQQDLLNRLLQEARKLPGFRWRPGQRVKSLISDGGRVQGVRLADGNALRADLVIGCDGRDSSLRQLSGLELRHWGAPMELLWLQLPAAGADNGTDAVLGSFLTLVGGGSIASACVGADGDLQLGWLLRPHEPTPQRSAEQWAAALGQLAPPQLAALLAREGQRLLRPQRLRVQVGQTRQWQRPGLLLLGDAAHPMSPVRAQGINLALRDSLVAAQELLPLVALAGPRANRHRALDRACLQIEQRRRPEVSQLQRLQLAEAQQGHWIGDNALVRHGLKLAGPLLGPLARRIWSARQRPLREGTAWLASG
ncbi:MAG: hypothetical protein RLZZ611_765 [Cyanobacteriota bacterium]|jgi:2-polyprenyl-6-methoxyphenol hydroxylase-like FAD-dependent oxidoreductase